MLMTEYQILAKTPSAMKPLAPKSLTARILMGCTMVLLVAGNADAKTTWEYRVVTVNTSPRQLEDQLNTNGAEGWELVEITPKGVAIFKRLKGR